MGIKLSRKKERNLKLSIIYRLVKLYPFNAKRKLKFLLDLSWIFNRLAHEQTFISGVKPNLDVHRDSIYTFVQKDGTVLDIGCGTGQVINRLLPKTKNIIGVDFNPVSTEIALKKFKNTGVQIINQDIFSYLNIHNHLKFDYIILSHLLEHIDKPQEFLILLSEKARYFYIEVPDFESNHLNTYRQIIGTDLIYTDGDHVSEFDREELETIITNSGLKIVSSTFRFGVMKYWCEKNHSY